MKKNISINISGIIFHIEEDGYDQLKNYIDSIAKYFSGYEDSQEIIADIENRIAEIFTGKLNKGKEVITAEDVTFLITTMGTISDFKAAEEKEDRFHSSTTEQKPFPNPPSSAPKKLYRDLKRKLLGGVAAGIGDYLSVDPIWIRLAIISVFFGISFIPALSGFTALCYIILWIVLPGSEVLENEENVKKLYRNPDDRMIAGVCSGLAAYFGADMALIRILFVIGLFLGGSTLIIYIVLAIITPEAKTTTEKMKMQGEPVTLSNIESNIKKSFNITDEKNANVLHKILMFPFRIISIVFTSISKAGGPVLLSLGEVVRVVLGISLIFFPMILLAVLIFALGIILGVIDEDINMLTHVLPLDVILAGIPKFFSLALFSVLSIPLIFISISGVCLLTKRNVIHPAITWAFLGFFAIAIVFTGFTIPGLVKDYRRKAASHEEMVFPIHQKTIILNANPNADIKYNKVNLYLKGYPGPDIRLVKRFSARGKSKQEAIQNGKMIDYSVVQKDSILTFDWNFLFKENAVFRGQHLNLVLYIPFGKEFLIKEDMDEILKSQVFHGYEHNAIERNRWVFEQEGIKCLSCKEQYWEKP